MDLAPLIKRASCGLLCACLVLLASSDALSAPILAGTTFFSGPNDGSAPPGLRLNGTVDYAVWAPGTFPYAGTANVPVPVTDYVYTYQIHNNPATGPLGYSQIPNLLDPENPTEISQLNIGVFATAGNIGEFTALPGVAPDTVLDTLTVGDAAYWYFGFFNPTDVIQDGQSSEGLLFTSPYTYTWARSTVWDNGTSANFFLPSPTSNPVPEPATVVLLGLGALSGLPSVARRWRRRG